MRAEEWAKWRDVISEKQQSGKSVAVFCRERDLRVWQFYEWRKRLRESEEAQFVEVEVKPVAKTTLSDAVHGQAIEVRLNSGRSLVVEAGFDAHHLRALLRVLESEA
jgi:transposase-like protein